MRQKLWSATKKEKISSNLYEYEKFLSKFYNYKITKNYSKLLNWSIKNKRSFGALSGIIVKLKEIKNINLNILANYLKINS